MRKRSWSRRTLGAPALLVSMCVAASCHDGLKDRDAAAPRPRAALSSASPDEATEMLFVQTAPVIPLFLNPTWGECNTRRFIGFPGPENPYAKLSPSPLPDPLLVLTELRPRPAP